MLAQEETQLQSLQCAFCFLLNTYCLPTISKLKKNCKWNLDKTFVLKLQIPSQHVTISAKGY